MSALAADWAASTLQTSRLILCMLPDDGTDIAVIKTLRTDWGIEAVDSIACRGVSALHKAKTQRADQLPESVFVKLLQIVVTEDKANAVFDAVYAIANIGRPAGGTIALSQPICVTPFRLPEDVPNERE